MWRHHESRERLIRPEISTILMPEVDQLDLPHIPVMWGSFNPDLFLANREKLLGLRRTHKLSAGQNNLLNMLTDHNYSPFRNFIKGFDKWTEVTDNIVSELNLRDIPDISKSMDQQSFMTLLRAQMEQAQGNIVMMSRPHSALYPTHRVLKEMAADQNEMVAEIVFDQHIDTVINPGIRAVTSGNVYAYLSFENLVHVPVILGPDENLIHMYKSRGEDKKIRRVIVADIGGARDREKQEVVRSLLDGLKKWNISAVTYTVDLDVLSQDEESYAVRYTPIAPFLGLGCQILPDTITPEALASLVRLQYPTPQMNYLLQEGLIHDSQQLDYARQFANADVNGVPKFAPESLSTDLGRGKGMKLQEVLRTIELFKKEMATFGMKDGILLKNGRLYKGAVVEMCGYEDHRKITSNAAIKASRAIAA